MTEIINPIIESGQFTALVEIYTEEEQLEYIKRFEDTGVFLVAECRKSQKVIGMQSVESTVDISSFRHVGDISTFISLQTRGKEVGSRLSKVTFQKAYEQGYKKLNAMVRGDNPKAITFYMRQGFKIIGTARKHALIRGRYIDEVMMELLLEEVPYKD